jgi:YegS/Rv2252/BmrU family lipid kinase
MPYAKFIVNPAAGAGKGGRKWPDVLQCIKTARLDFDYVLTEAPGHAETLAESAAKDGYGMVVAVGGDGTLNEIINGLYIGQAIDRMFVGIVSAGTGGDYIRTIGIPRDIGQACQRLVSPEKRVVDLGVMEYTYDNQTVKRLFVNFAGLGFDAEIVRATTLKYKKLGSIPSYLMGLLTTLLFYRNKDVSLVIDGESVQSRICSIMMSIGKYGGGGMMTAPDADPADGLFDVLIIDDIAKPDLLRSVPLIYSGSHLTHPKVSVRRAREVRVTSDQGMPLQADGELLGEAPASFRILPDALTLAV